MARAWGAVRVAVAWIAFAAIVFVAVVSDLGGRDGGAVACMVLLAVAGGVFAHLAARGVLTVERTRAATLGGLFIGLAVGLFLGVEAPPSYARIERAYEALRMPAGVTLVGHAHTGNALCTRGCPSVLHRYQTAQLGLVVADAVRSSLIEQGYAVTGPDTDGGGVTTFTARHGSRTIAASVVPEPGFTSVRLVLELG